MFFPWKPSGLSLFVGFALGIFLSIPGYHATIAVDDTNLEFDSISAAFGKPWIDNVEYRAHLQFLDSRPFLCQGDQDMPSLPNYNDDYDGHAHRMLHDETNHTSTLYKVDDDLPIAVLVSRGACSFEEKARETLLLQPEVEFCIVYDVQSGTHFFPASASGESDDITVGMLFVSYSTGIQLLQMLKEQSDNVTAHGSLIITMDNPIPDYAAEGNDIDAEGWVVDALNGLFSFLMCFGCLVICLRAGSHAEDAASYLGSGLMTEEQVLELPCVAYGSAGGVGGAVEEGDSEDTDNEAGATSRIRHHQTSCAVCIEEYNEGDQLRQLPCQHEFHTECILPWLTERHSSCPLCKHDAVSQPEGDKDDSDWVHLRRWFIVSLLPSVLRPGRTLVSGDEDHDEEEGTRAEVELTSLEEVEESEEREVFVDEPGSNTEEPDGGASF